MPVLADTPLIPPDVSELRSRDLSSSFQPKRLLDQQRSEANRRERQRVQAITTAYEDLLVVTPRDEAEPQLARIEIVRRAAGYIQYLTDFLQQINEAEAVSQGPVVHPSVDLEPPAMRETFMQYEFGGSVQRLEKKRVVCNARARVRCKGTKAAFDRLKECIPVHETEPELSRLAILRRATDYIAQMTLMLEEEESRENTDDNAISPSSSEGHSNAGGKSTSPSTLGSCNSSLTPTNSSITSCSSSTPLLPTSSSAQSSDNTSNDSPSALSQGVGCNHCSAAAYRSTSPLSHGENLTLSVSPDVTYGCNTDSDYFSNANSTPTSTISSATSFNFDCIPTPSCSSSSSSSSSSSTDSCFSEDLLQLSPHWLDDLVGPTTWLDTPISYSQSIAPSFDEQSCSSVTDPLVNFTCLPSTPADCSSIFTAYQPPTYSSSANRFSNVYQPQATMTVNARRLAEEVFHQVTPMTMTSPFSDISYNRKRESLTPSPMSSNHVSDRFVRQGDSKTSSHLRKRRPLLAFRLRQRQPSYHGNHHASRSFCH